MKIIINADDFGFDNDTLEATKECFRKGLLSSATIMVGCETGDKAIQFAKNHPEFSFGVHLTYVDGLKPLCNKDEIPSFVDNNGFFLPSDKILKKALLAKIPVIETQKETAAQIKRIIDGGIKMSHVDSHGHLHKYPPFIKAFRQLGIKKVRRVQNVHLGKSTKGGIKTMLKNSINWWLDQNIARNFKTTDYFYMPANCFETGWAKQFLTVMNSFPDNATIELGIHPGAVEMYRRCEINDLEEFCSLLKKSKHQLISWKDI